HAPRLLAVDVLLRRKVLHFAGHVRLIARRVDARQVVDTRLSCERALPELDDVVAQRIDGAHARDDDAATVAVAVGVHAFRRALARYVARPARFADANVRISDSIPSRYRRTAARTAGDRNATPAPRSPACATAASTPSANDA